MSLFIVGTATEVGKTVISAILLARYGRRQRLAYWKPVATGARDGRDTEHVERWTGHLVDVLPETYLYEQPVSPHLAARQERRPIDPEHILAELVRHGLADARRNLVIEGVGGLLVPMTESGYLLIDLLRDISLPCLLVARSTLGTINHTLLSIEALRARDQSLAGVVLVGPRNRENRRAIERHGDTNVVAEVEWMARLGRKSIESAARRFDTRAKLKRYFEA